MIPIVATEPSCFTHSCEDAYLSPSNTAKIHINTYIYVSTFIQLDWKKEGIYEKIPVEKHLEMEKGGERCNLEEEEESLRALAVEEAHILSAIVKTISASLFVFVIRVQIIIKISMK